LLIIPESSVYQDEKGVWDFTAVRFCFDKRTLYQLIAFRRVHLVEALALNFFIDLLVYFLAHCSLQHFQRHFLSKPLKDSWSSNSSKTISTLL
jgi:hypothetical protein